MPEYLDLCLLFFRKKKEVGYRALHNYAEGPLKT